MVEKEGNLESITGAGRERNAICEQRGEAWKERVATSGG